MDRLSSGNRIELVIGLPARSYDFCFDISLDTDSFSRKVGKRQICRSLNSAFGESPFMLIIADKEDLIPGKYDSA